MVDQPGGTGLTAVPILAAPAGRMGVAAAVILGVLIADLGVLELAAQSA
jgi:hypothetical protein